MARVLDRWIVEVRYSFGHLYLDRCGQTIVDLEASDPYWVVSEANPSTGTLNHSRDNVTLQFTPHLFNISAQEPKPNFMELVEQTWGIVKRNLSLNEITRIGSRFQYLSPASTETDAEKQIASSSLEMKYPEHLKTAFSVKARHFVTVLERNETEYRIELAGITRRQGQLPPHLEHEPRFLSTGQRQARIELEKQRAKYQKSPKFAVMLDVDCVLPFGKAGKVIPHEFAQQQHQVVKSEFLSLLRT